MAPRKRRQKIQVEIDPVDLVDRLAELTLKKTEANRDQGKGAVTENRLSRKPSASEVARSAKLFEEWAHNQRLQRVCFSDLPTEFKPYAESVLNFDARIPLDWVTKDSIVRKHMKELTPDFVAFIKKAHRARPSLFYSSTEEENEVDTKTRQALFTDLHAVFLAWKRLKQMTSSHQNWSESEYATNVYNVFRSPAVRRSLYRTHCGIALSRPILQSDTRSTPPTAPAMIIPDGLIFLNPSSIRSLSEGTESPYSTLNRNPDLFVTPEDSLLRVEATPRFNIGDKPQFEFVSSCWEDKKSSDDQLESAYRQNRMVCAAVCRQIRAFGIRLPVFGIIWTQGKVMVHVDWCVEAKKGRQTSPILYSAAYPGPKRSEPAEDSDDESETEIPTSVSDANKSRQESRFEFHQWDLSKPHEILQVYCLLRNLDMWTSGTFRDKVKEGVNGLVAKVEKKGFQLEEWKAEQVPRRDPLKPLTPGARVRRKA